MELERRLAASASALGFLALAWLLLGRWLGPAPSLAARNLGSLLFTQLLFVSLAWVAAFWTSSGGAAARLGLHRPRIPAWAVVLGIGAILAWSYGLHAMLVLADLRETGNLARVDEVVRAGVERHAMATLIAVSLAPAIGEELLFRGFVFGAAQRFGGGVAAVVVSAGLFGLVHGDVVHGSVAFVLGLALGSLRLWSGSVLVPMAAHLVNNTGGALAELAGVPIPGTGWVGGACALAAGAGLLALVARSRRPSPGTPPEWSPSGH